jgi:HlyD family secretion protein
VGLPVLTVADVKRPYADVFVPEGETAGVRLGAIARATVDGQPQEVPGRIERVYRRTEFTPSYLFSEGERSNLVLRVRVRFDDPQGLLHAGLPVFVRLEGVTASAR